MAADGISLDRRAMQVLETTLDRALAAADDDVASLELGVRVAELLLHTRMVAPTPAGPSRDAFRQEGAPRIAIVLGPSAEVPHDPLVDRIDSTRREIEATFGVPVPQPAIVREADMVVGVGVLFDGIPAATPTIDASLDSIAAAFRSVSISFLPELLTREEVAELLEVARQDSPMVVEELVPNMLALGQLRQVLQNLVREQVPIRDLSTILNALADHAVYTKDPHALTEHVRSSLGRRICARHQSDDGLIHAFRLASDAERAIQNAVQLNETGQVLMLDPNTSTAIQHNLAEAVRRHDLPSERPVLVVPTKIRRHVRSLLERSFPMIVVLSHAEIVAGAPLEFVETIETASFERPPTSPDRPSTGSWLEV